MNLNFEIVHEILDDALPGHIIVFADSKSGLTGQASLLDTQLDGQLGRAINQVEFSCKSGKSLKLVPVNDAGIITVTIVGIQEKEQEAIDFKLLGGKLNRCIHSKQDTLILLPGHPQADTWQHSQMMLGLMLGAYKFRKYQSGRDEDDKVQVRTVRWSVSDVDALKKSWDNVGAIAEGVNLARELMNEPANMLGTLEFAARAQELEKLGVEIDVLEESEMRELGMRALLGVARGSAQPARLVVMHWRGGEDNEIGRASCRERVYAPV